MTHDHDALITYHERHGEREPIPMENLNRLRLGCHASTEEEKETCVRSHGAIPCFIKAEGVGVGMRVRGAGKAVECEPPGVVLRVDVIAHDPNGIAHERALHEIAAVVLIDIEIECHDPIVSREHLNATGGIIPVAAAGISKTPRIRSRSSLCSARQVESCLSTAGTRA